MTDLAYVEHCLLLPDPDERVKRFEGDERLHRLLPEVYALDGVAQPPDFHPEGDVLVHTLLALYHLPEGADRRLAWAALLHDIGKAQTTREIDGRMRAFGHDRAGGKLAEKLLERLGMEQVAREDISWLVRHHMFALSWQVDELQALSRRQRRFIADRRFGLLVELMVLDALASGPNRQKLAQAGFYQRAHQLHGVPPGDG